MKFRLGIVVSCNVASCPATGHLIGEDNKAQLPDGWAFEPLHVDRHEAHFGALCPIHAAMVDPYDVGEEIDGATKSGDEADSATKVAN
jgi:hypothetical protein